jgi:hypothetical protein
MPACRKAACWAAGARVGNLLVQRHLLGQRRAAAAVLGGPAEAEPTALDHRRDQRLRVGLPVRAACAARNARTSARKASPAGPRSKAECRQQRATTRAILPGTVPGDLGMS